VAIVTGGGRGIGKSIALTLAEAGADVVVTARTLKLLEETADEIRKLGTRALAVRADLTSEQDVEALVDKTISEFAKIDILVNNAGAIQSRPLVEMPGFKNYLAKLVPDFYTPFNLESWKDEIDTNLTTAYLATAAVLPRMIQAGNGKIINITSVEPLRPGSFHVPYSSAKWGLKGFTRALALEMAKYHIYVNAVAPGYIYTEMSSFWHDDPIVGKRMFEQVPLQRMGKPRDVALAVLFLASDASNFITGHEIPLDGGFCL